MTAALEYPHQIAPEHGTTLELAPGIRWLQMPMGGSLNHINLYLLEDAAGWTVVDTGLATQEVTALWHRIFEQQLGGKPVVRVICTHMHPDHIGQAGMICDHFRAPLAMSEREYFHARTFANSNHMGSWHADRFYHRHGMPDETYAQLKAGWDHRRRQREAGGDEADAYAVPPLPPSYERLEDGDTISIGERDWRVVVGAGHSPEHVCLYCRASGIMLSGDQILPVITSNVSVHVTEPEANPLKQWMESHDRFLEFPDDTLVLPAHNLPFRGLRRRLRALIEHHDDRMLLLEEQCTEPRLAADLLPALFSRKLDPFQTMMGLGECIAHLHLLMHQSRLERRLDADGRYRFVAIDPSLARRARPDRHDRADDAPNYV